MVNENVRDSFKRCESAGDFADTFYGIFLEKSPEIAELFANTDFKKQRTHLRSSVLLLVSRDINEPKAKHVIGSIGTSHSKANLNIRPELYDVWLESLCETVKQMDPEWSAELETGWRTQVQPGIDVITSMY